MQINQLRSQGSSEATDALWALANGPSCLVHQYSGCMVNGIRFVTIDRDNRHKSQNSRVVVEGDHNEKNIDFFDYLTNIFGLSYINGSEVVLFKCEWYNTGHKTKINIEAHVTSIYVGDRWYEEDPFVLPNQVNQVFYVNDTKLGRNWKVVEWVKHWGVWDVQERDEESEENVINEPYQQEEAIETVSVSVAEDFSFCYTRDDIEPDIILEDNEPAADGDEPIAGDGGDEDETLAEYINEEETDQSDLDIDSDMEL